MKKIVTTSEEETKNIGMKVASRLKKGDVIVLSGDLGSGKTKFVEGILKYFGKEDEISSPTFTIVNEYNTDNVNIYHFDVYRLEDEDEFYAIGGEEYFDKGICLIEWGEKFLDLLPNSYRRIEFSRKPGDENVRNLVFENFGDIIDI